MRAKFIGMGDGVGVQGTGGLEKGFKGTRGGHRHCLPPSIRSAKGSVSARWGLEQEDPHSLGWGGHQTLCAEPTADVLMKDLYNYLKPKKKSVLHLKKKLTCSD